MRKRTQLQAHSAPDDTPTVWQTIKSMAAFLLGIVVWAIGFSVQSMFPNLGRRVFRALAILAILILVVGLALSIFGPRWISPAQVLAFGAKGSEPGGLNKPTYLGVDGRGNIYVGDWNDGHISVFDSNGKFVRLIDLGGSVTLLGMAVTPGGSVYASYGGDIHRVDAQGHQTKLTCQDVKGNPFNVTGVALAPDGSLVGADRHGDLLRCGPDGAANVVLAAVFDLPSFSSQNELEPHSAPILSYDVRANSADTNVSVAVDRSGDIYAVGWTIGDVVKTDPQGKSLSKFGGFANLPGGLERGLFDFPSALAVDSTGRIYVGDSNGVHVFDANEQYLYSLRFDGVDALAFDADNNLYLVTYPPQVIKLGGQKP